MTGRPRSAAQTERLPSHLQASTDEHPLLTDLHPVGRVARPSGVVEIVLAAEPHDALAALRRLNAWPQNRSFSVRPLQSMREERVASSSSSFSSNVEGAPSGRVLGALLAAEPQKATASGQMSFLDRSWGHCARSVATNPEAETEADAVLDLLQAENAAEKAEASEAPDVATPSSRWTSLAGRNTSMSEVV